MSWSFSNDKPIFQQLEERIVLEIISGRYEPGSKLEPVRELAMTAGVNPNTMQRALADIENTGIIYTKRGDGRYITENTEIINEIRNRYVLKKTEDFIASVKALGLDEDGIVKAVREALEQGG